MVYQSLWWLKANEETSWRIVAGIEHDLGGANPDVAALVADFNATNAAVEYIVKQTAGEHFSMTKKQEWATPPRVLRADIQPTHP